MKILFPDFYVESIFHIPVDQLKSAGVEGLLFDIDNTIVPYYIQEADEKIIAFFKSLGEQGFAIGLLSNGKKSRVELFSKKLGIPFVYRAGKPRIKKLKQALGLIGKDAKQTAMIGDQVFTDVWCGNRAGVYTVLVSPVSEKDEWITKIKRGAEKMVLRRYLKKNPQKRI